MAEDLLIWLKQSNSYEDVARNKNTIDNLAYKLLLFQFSTSTRDPEDFWERGSHERGMYSHTVYLAHGNGKGEAR